MRLCRRAFLRTGSAGLAAFLGPWGRPRPSGILKPPRLAPGDTVGLINPVSVRLDTADIESVTRRLEALGMRVKCGTRCGAALGDRERAAEIGALFADPSVKAILPIRGGWGSARLLPHLDYDVIRRHPKVLMGSSDVAALLLGIHARTGLVTFHGPLGMSPWVPFTVEQMRRVLFRGEAITIVNPSGPGVEDEEDMRTITPGRARGRLFGGNLTVVSSIVGSPYFVPGKDAILFLEEVREPISEVARMLTQLELAGALRGLRGLVFGQCTRCDPPLMSEFLTLDEVLREQVGALGIPAWRGALIGHVARQFTVPIGVAVEIDAAAGSIRLLESAVS